MTTSFLRLTGKNKQKSHLLRWILTLSLVIYFGPASDGATTDPPEYASKSVLDLQRLVDKMLVANDAQSATVLDLQHVLLVAVQPEPTPGEEQPAPQEDAVLPPHSRFLLPASLPSVRSIEIMLASDNTTVSPPLVEDTPPTAGTVMRYQYHLLSNAPPLSSMCPVV